ncbi:MAG: hypothetical protein PHY12_15145 [Eubacteriales bacterium]|nr:hypothetical protein [Eubacteriales bacterium]
MATATFYPARLHGEAVVPPAKSEAHRAILLAALGRGRCRLNGFPPPLCDDTEAMISGVTALGASVEREGNALIVTPGKPAQGPAQCDVRACGAAVRMLIPAFLLRGQTVRIWMEDGLFARPLTAFDPLCARLGAKLERVPSQGGVRAHIDLSGAMPTGEYEIDGTLSSQFASGLLIALSHTDGPSVLTVTRPIVSRPYLDMTLRQMERFGLAYEEPEEGRFRLSPATRENPQETAVSGDWSQAAVLLCLNAMGHGILLSGMQTPDSGCLQGDSRVVELLRAMGLRHCRAKDALYLLSPSHARLNALDVDCENIPDLAPILALTCTQARGTSTLRGVKRLRVKECDRLNATVEALTRLGAEVSVSADDEALTVKGGARLKGGFTLGAHGDHRMVMLLAAAATLCDAPITVEGVESLNKSWPGFLSTYQQLGGKVT